jgi:hypothetical protein
LSNPQVRRNTPDALAVLTDSRPRERAFPTLIVADCGYGEIAADLGWSYKKGHF